MTERQRGKRNILQTLNDSKLMKRYRLDHAGVMFVVDLIRDALTSPNQCNHAITPEIEVITTLIWPLEKCNSAAVHGRLTCQPASLLM